VLQTAERRRLQRVHLLEPLPGRIEGRRVFVLDLSRTGLRVAHQESLGVPGDRLLIEFEWDARPVAIECRLTHSQIHGGARTVYHSGLTIIAAPPRSADVLREVIAWHVERALDEQKANARGIPAVAARSYQTGVARDFIRHVYAAGRWHEVQTTDAKQPIHGFTISSSQTAAEVAMLRSAWEAGDAAARTVIQRMAELSISRTEGIPTRRYVP
jgi:hypothetical protein